MGEEVLRIHVGESMAEKVDGFMDVGADICQRHPTLRLWLAEAFVMASGSSQRGQRRGDEEGGGSVHSIRDPFQTEPEPKSRQHSFVRP